jgi:YYY domain-containing protein
MFDLLRMWALVEGLGLVCMPLTVMVCRNLPDRGWAFSKALGMALLAFLVWLPLMWLTFLPFSQMFILGIFLVLLGGNFFVFLRSRQVIFKLLRLNLLYIVASELVFLGMVLLLGWLRTNNPNIESFEMFMDEGFIAAIMRSTHLPPNDMWFAGYSINYYYYAHYVIAMLAKLLGQPAAVAFNTGISIYFGLTAVNLFGVTCNIVAWARHQRTQLDTDALEPGQAHPSLTRSIGYGLFSILTGLVLGNLAATQQWWQHHESVSYDWFTPSRVIEKTINEFPAFSFLLSCFHAHVLALAFTMLGVGLVFNLFLEPRGRGLALFGRGLRLPLTLGVTALVIGGLFVMNGWDYPTYVGLALVCLGLQQWPVHQKRVSFTLAFHIVVPALALVLLSLFLYLPFYLHFVSPSLGLGIVTKATDRSPLAQELLIYGLFAFIFISLLLASALMQPRSQNELPPGQVPLFKDEAGEEQATEDERSQQEDVERSPVENWLWQLTYVIVLFVAAIVLLLFLPNSLTLVVFGSGAALGVLLMLNYLEERAQAYTLLLGALAFALVAGCEVFFLRDVFAAQDLPRFNTVFKFYFQAWGLLSIVAGCGLYFVLSAFSSISVDTLLGSVLRWGGGVLWSTVLAVLVVASCAYPILATPARYGLSDPANVNINHWGAESLDGMAYLKTLHTVAPRPNTNPKQWFDYQGAGDYAALTWLNTHVEGAPTIIEAIGDDYTVFGRVSAFTGLPTSMGWVGHEYQWRVNWLNNDAAWRNFNQRSVDVDTIYTEPDTQAVLDAMKRQGAQYLYVGPLEAGKYVDTDLQRFRGFMQVVYDAQGVTIYKLK